MMHSHRVSVPVNSMRAAPCARRGTMGRVLPVGVPACALLAALTVLLRAAPLLAQDSRGALAAQAGLDQRLDATVPLDATFTTETGQVRTLGSLFAGKPVILDLGYYRCPMVCRLTLKGLLDSLRNLRSFDAGREFTVIAVSIDPLETAALGAAKKEDTVAYYGRPGAQDGFHFLTGRPAAITRLAKAVGFRYTYDPVSKQYAHPAGIMILTPGGKVSRYFYGIDYPARDLRLALVEAAGGKIGGVTDTILLLCYGYDPATGRYSFLVLKVMRLLAMITVLVLVAVIAGMVLRERVHPGPSEAA